MARSVLMVSKPVVAPWNDSGKNIVRDIVTATPDVDFHVMTTRGAAPPAPGVTVEAIYGDPGSYRPSLRQNLRVLRRLLRPDRIPIYHFFFAPNPRTSKMARMVLRLKRRRSVHTVCSVPKTFEGVAELMFAERVVALSEATRAALERHGVSGLVHIPPAVPPAEPLDGVALAAAREALGLGDDPVVLYAGDLEFSKAADAVVEAALRLVRARPVRFVLACRFKQEASREVRARLEAEVAAAGAAERVHFLDEVDDMRPLLALAHVHVQPAGNLYAKMDLPLVLLESLREGVPLVVADRAPLNELLADDVGLAVPPEDGSALAAAIERLLDDPAQRQTLAENARRAAAERYGLARLGRDYAALYDELAPAGGEEEPVEK